MLVDPGQLPLGVGPAGRRVRGDQSHPVRRAMDLEHPSVGPHRQLPSTRRIGLQLPRADQIAVHLRRWIGHGPHPGPRELAGPVHVVERPEARPGTDLDDRRAAVPPLLRHRVETTVQRGGEPRRIASAIARRSSAWRCAAASTAGASEIQGPTRNAAASTASASSAPNDTSATASAAATTAPRSVSVGTTLAGTSRRARASSIASSATPDRARRAALRRSPHRGPHRHGRDRRRARRAALRPAQTVAAIPTRSSTKRADIDRNGEWSVS